MWALLAQLIAICCDIKRASLRVVRLLRDLLRSRDILRVMDDLDGRILLHLMRNARATFADIGSGVGLSAPAVKRRVDRLVADKTISGFTTIVDPESLGWNTEAYVNVFCKGNVSPDNLLRSWESIHEVVSACTVTGAADALLRVRARDVRHLEQALEKLREDESIDHTETIIVLSRLIDRG